MKQAVKITVSGKVQGVGFRYHTLRKAQELDVCGTVQNLPDGRVFIEAEARQEQLDIFIAWCHEGPRWSQVEEVIVHPAGLVNFREFSIL